MILSMYYPIFEGQRCIGFVGAGVYASHLMDVLLNLNIKGLPDSEYVFLNVENGVYLYHQDEALLNQRLQTRGTRRLSGGSRQRAAPRQVHIPTGMKTVWSSLLSTSI